MWSVAAPRTAQRDDGQRRDPAPSKLAYRYHRMMLRPVMRRLVTQVLPVCFAVGIVAFWATRPGPQAWLQSRMDQMWEAVESRPEFRVSAMSIEGATPEVTAQIRAALALDFPASQFDLDLDALRGQLLELPPVKSASLQVRSPGILDVSVTERQPVALLRNETGLHLIAADGVLVGAVPNRAARADLPLLAGAGVESARVVAEATALLAAAKPLADRTRALVRRGERRWDLVLDRDQRILLPARRPVEALERAVALHQATELLERDLVAVDLRLPHRPTLRMSPAANETMRAARLAFAEEK